MRWRKSLLIRAKSSLFAGNGCQITLDGDFNASMREAIKSFQNAGFELEEVRAEKPAPSA